MHSSIVVLISTGRRKCAGVNVRLISTKSHSIFKIRHVFGKTIRFSTLQELGIALSCKSARTGRGICRKNVTDRFTTFQFQTCAHSPPTFALQYVKPHEKCTGIKQ